MASGLKHIADSQVHESALTTFCGSFTFDNATIKYCVVDPSIPQVTIEVYVLGVKVGGGTLNPSNPHIKIGGSHAGFKVELELDLDVAKREVTYKIEVCAPIVGCESKSGVLVSW